MADTAQDLLRAGVRSSSRQALVTAYHALTPYISREEEIDREIFHPASNLQEILLNFADIAENVLSTTVEGAVTTNDLSVLGSAVSKFDPKERQARVNKRLGKGTVKKAEVASAKAPKGVK